MASASWMAATTFIVRCLDMEKLSANLSDDLMSRKASIDMI